MSWKEDLAVARFPTANQTVLLSLHGEPKLSWTKSGKAKVTVPEVHFYRDDEPPRLITKRPVNLFEDAWGDVSNVISAYGSADYSTLLSVTPEERWPGSSQVVLRINLQHQPRLSKYVLDTDAAGMHSPPTPASPGPLSQAPPAQPSTAVGRPSGLANQVMPPQVATGQGANPLSHVHAWEPHCETGKPPLFRCKCGAEVGPGYVKAGDQESKRICGSCGKPTGGISSCPHCGVKQ